jgi:hypothetical protein
VSAGRAISQPPPTGTARLFPHQTTGVPLEQDSRAFLIARLLEEGETDDLRWLNSVVTAAELADWVRSRGPRQLSERSLRFWALMLGAEVDDGPGDALWPR